MTSTQPTLMAMWRKSSAAKASSDLVSLHSIRGGAVEVRSTPDKEATSSLSKPVIGCSKAAQEGQVTDEGPCQTSTKGPPRGPAGPKSGSPAWQARKRKRDSQDNVIVIDSSQEPSQPDSVACCKPDSALDAEQAPGGMLADLTGKTYKGSSALLQQRQQQQQPRAGTPEEKAALLTKLATEAASLKRHVLGMRPSLQLTADNSGPSLDRSLVARYLLGCGQTLQDVTQHVLSIYSDSCRHSGPTDTAVRDMIVDLATRKSFAATNTAISSMNHMEDTSEERLWQWELRDVKDIPKSLKSSAREHKKFLQGVAKRLTVLQAACMALETSSKGKAAQTKLQKALFKLQSVENPLVSQPTAPTSAPHVPAPEVAAAASRMPGSQAVRASAPHQAATQSAQEARRKAAREAEKEQGRLEREQGKQADGREKQEKAAAKGKARQEKLAEKSGREAEGAGFGSEKFQAEAAAIMHSFFKTPGKAQPEKAASQPAKSPQTAQKPQQPYLQPRTSAPEHARLPVPEEQTASKNEAAARLTEEELQQEHHSLIAPQAVAFKRIPGPQQACLLELSRVLEEAGSAGEPVIISCLPGSNLSDPALFLAQQPLVMASHKITMPPSPAIHAEPVAGARYHPSRQ